MRVKEFRSWLVDVAGCSVKVASDHSSRLKRIEKSLSEYLGKDIDLDKEYLDNKCNRVIDLISYKSVVEMPNTINLPKEKLHITVHRLSVRKYIKFCEVTL